MGRHAAYLWGFCAIFLVFGCTSAPDPAPEPEEANSLDLLKTPAPTRPEYHAESDAVSFGTRESRTLAEAACAGLEDPSACQDQADRRLRGYRGSFTEPGADEALVALPDAAVLLAKANDGWRTRARAQQVDIDHCLVVAQPDADQAMSLLCRAAATDGEGFGLGFFGLSTAEDGQLEVRHLDAPRATDVDTSLFAGWKHEEDVIEVRFHKETQVKGTSTMSFGGPNVCRYRTFGYQQAPKPALVEVEGCKAEPREDEPGIASASRRHSPYENRLDAPISKHNREYVMCYHHELERLKELSEQALADEAEESGDSRESDEAKETKKTGEADETDETDEPAEPIAGDIHVRFVIGSSGAPVSCEIAQSTMLNENVETCLCREIMNTPFPPVPSGKFVDVTYPFSFAPAGE